MSWRDFHDVLPQNGYVIRKKSVIQRRRRPAGRPAQLDIDESVARADLTDAMTLAKSIASTHEGDFNYFAHLLLRGTIWLPGDVAHRIDYDHLYSRFSSGLGQLRAFHDGLARFDGAKDWEGVSAMQSKHMREMIVPRLLKELSSRLDDITIEAVSLGKDQYLDAMIYLSVDKLALDSVIEHSELPVYVPGLYDGLESRASNVLQSTVWWNVCAEASDAAMVRKGLEYVEQRKVGSRIDVASRFQEYFKPEWLAKHGGKVMAVVVCKLGFASGPGVVGVGRSTTGMVPIQGQPPQPFDPEHFRAAQGLLLRFIHFGKMSKGDVALVKERLGGKRLGVPITMLTGAHNGERGFALGHVRTHSRIQPVSRILFISKEWPLFFQICGIVS